MKRQSNTYKWERATLAKRERRPVAKNVSTMQLYREISDGYDQFMAKRIRSATLRREGNA
jgi:hypothetical protein